MTERNVLETYLENLAAGRRCLPPRLYAYGFSWRKRSVLRRFAAPSEIRFVRSLRSLPSGAPVLVWASRELPACGGASQAYIRVEDGFLRSVGLGADLVAPLSWVFDSTGIYYDSTGPSDLETLLLTAEFGKDLTRRAATLRERLVALGLTKYNVGHAAWERPARAQRVILVPGQVHGDASLRRGAPDVDSNLALLQRVRYANPDAYVLYKRHPDVAAGLRTGGPGESHVHKFCDAEVTSVSMSHLLDAVDEVHVMTSLAGFEALLRGRRVVCYGQPFYSGYGLTSDVIPVVRRTRRLTLDQLVAGALILYPVYVSRRTGRHIEVEAVLDELAEWRRAGASGPTPLQRMLRGILRRVASR